METLNRKPFDHMIIQPMYDKAMVKYNKMIETDNGKKFFEHLAKSFVIDPEKNGDSISTVKDCDSENGIFKCDLTGQKLISESKFNEYKVIYNTKIDSLIKDEDESDEHYAIRFDMYRTSLRSSNPYAVDACLGYTYKTTDKILSYEALSALIDKTDEITAEPEKYGNL